MGNIRILVYCFTEDVPLARNTEREIVAAGYSGHIATSDTDPEVLKQAGRDCAFIFVALTDKAVWESKFWDTLLYLVADFPEKRIVFLRLSYEGDVPYESLTRQSLGSAQSIADAIELLYKSGNIVWYKPYSYKRGPERWSMPGSQPMYQVEPADSAPASIEMRPDVTYGIWSPDMPVDMDDSGDSDSAVGACLGGVPGIVGFFPFLGGLFRRKPKKPQTTVATACVYAPAAVRASRHFVVRVFVLRPDEAEKVDTSVKEVDPKAVKKTNKPLELNVKDGSRISVLVKMSPGVSVDEPLQTETWRGRYIEFDFMCRVEDKSIESISANALVAVDNVPKGNLKFVIDVEEIDHVTRYAKVKPSNATRVFISYSHNDYYQVRGIAEGCRISGTDYFFDRHTLQPGDLFKEKIKEYISNADIFVLCWSKNAAESEWVQIERHQALELVKEGKKDLHIWAIHVSPQAPPPSDMSDDYHFASL